jgi:hypothetical protein
MEHLKLHLSGLPDAQPRFLCHLVATFSSVAGCNHILELLFVLTSLLIEVAHGIVDPPREKLGMAASLSRTVLVSICRSSRSSIWPEARQVWFAPHSARLR